MDLSGGAALAPPLAPPSAHGLAGGFHCAAEAVHLVAMPFTLVMTTAYKDVLSTSLAVAQVEVADVNVAVWVNVAAGAVAQAMYKLPNVASTSGIVVCTASMLCAVKPAAFVY